MISSKLHLMGKQHRRIKATIESLAMVHHKTYTKRKITKQTESLPVQFACGKPPALT